VISRHVAAVSAAVSVLIFIGTAKPSSDEQVKQAAGRWELESLVHDGDLLARVPGGTSGNS